MPYAWRLFRPVLLVTLLAALAFPLASPRTYAQDDDGESPVVIQGSLQLEELVQALVDAYLERNSDAAVTVDAQGPSQGFEALCAGEADIVMSTEPISDQQIAACDAGANFVETVIAYQAVVLLAPPTAEVTCLDRNLIESLWSLGAPAEVTWADLASPTLTGPVSFFGPESFTPAYQLFAALLTAGELRDDIQLQEDPAAVLDAITAEGSSVLGFMSLADYEQTGAGGLVTPVAVRNERGECITPAQSTLEGRSYPLASSAYLYVNAASADDPAVVGFMQFVLLDETGAQTIAAEQGYTVPLLASLEYGMNNLLEGRAGRTFSRPITPVDVSTATEGSVRVVGTSQLYSLTQSIANEFQGQYIAADVTFNTLGNDAGWQAFCAGEADVLQATRAATDEEQALCEENGIDPYTLDLGSEALIFAVPASNDWAECLNAENVSALLGRGTDEAPAPTAWNAVDGDWPELDLLLVAPPRSTGETDYVIVSLLGDLTFAVRGDLVTDDDPLYRAQGVANTDNGLTWLWWSEFQGSEAEVSLPAVDAGEGCVAPSAETIRDGSYPLSFPVQIHFSQQAFDNPILRAFLWHFFERGSIETLGERPFEGLDIEALDTTVRDEVFDLLSAYEETAAEAAPEAEATGEAPEATEEAEVAATEAAPAATEEAAATPEATEEAPAATEEAAATPEATEAAE